MNQLNENEKAAIAAGLWKPHRECPKGAQAKYHRAAPDMHDPANLWRALETLKLPIVGVNPQTGNWCCSILLRRHQSKHTHFETPKLADAIFAALVALYDGEHPEEI